MTPSDYTKATNSGQGSNMDDLRDKAQDVIESTREQAGEMLERGEECVRNNSLSAVIVALAAGFILGLVAGPSRPTLRSRFFDEPRDRSQGAILAAALTIAAFGRKIFGSARSFTDDALDSTRSLKKPIRKAVKKAARSMHMR